VFLTGLGEIKAGVDARKAGAQDFLEKTSSAAVLMMEAIERALAQYERRRAEHDRLQKVSGLIASLSAPEAEVFGLIVRGHQVMEKIAAKLLAEVLLIAADIGRTATTG
jgi:FixJ family two-component response regulator